MKATLQLIRSATIKLKIDGFTLLVDPYLAPQGKGRSYAGVRTSPLVPLPCAVDELLADVDAVFVSHLHSDHFDEAAREVIPKSMPLLCPDPLASALAADGFKDVRPIGDDTPGPLGIRLTSGQHGPEAVLEEMGNVAGFVLPLGRNKRLYWVGDSIDCPAVQQVLREYQPSVVVVHACGADWNGVGPLVMDCGMVESVLNAAPQARVIATHMDAVDHATVSRADLLRYFGSKPALMARMSIPLDGETISLA